MNGNGRWFHSVWLKSGAKPRPTKSGWYAARPYCCNITVKLHLEENLYDCYVEGDEFFRDADDYEWWYKLKSPHDSLPEFKG